MYNIVLICGASEAEASLQHAEEFIEWDLNHNVPLNKRTLMENLYKTKLYMIRTEISFHSGDIAAAFERVSKLREAFLNLAPSIQRLLTSHCYVSVKFCCSQ
jgi:pyruvate/2-oxoglutarate/acetoin dehydrogenase E1 component